MTKPTHTAYVVADAPAGSDRKAKWREVGAVWKHNSGDGFDLVVFDQVAVSGRIVCMPRKDDVSDAADG